MFDVVSGTMFRLDRLLPFCGCLIALGHGGDIPTSQLIVFKELPNIDPDGPHHLIIRSSYKVGRAREGRTGVVMGTLPDCQSYYTGLGEYWQPRHKPLSNYQSDEDVLVLASQMETVMFGVGKMWPGFL